MLQSYNLLEVTSDLELTWEVFYGKLKLVITRHPGLDMHNTECAWPYIMQFYVLCVLISPQKLPDSC